MPEVEKIKNALQAKTTEVEDMHTAIDKLKKNYEDKLSAAKQEYEDLEKLHSICPKHLKNL